jgi:hypothetical protein
MHVYVYVHDFTCVGSDCVTGHTAPSPAVSLFHSLSWVNRMCVCVYVCICMCVCVWGGARGRALRCVAAARLTIGMSSLHSLTYSLHKEMRARVSVRERQTDTD